MDTPPAPGESSSGSSSYGAVWARKKAVHARVGRRFIPGRFALSLRSRGQACKTSFRFSSSEPSFGKMNERLRFLPGHFKINVLGIWEPLQTWPLNQTTLACRAIVSGQRWCRCQATRSSPVGRRSGWPSRSASRGR
eukprot:154931-Alexandrium_andersonii.AAC.1